MARSVRARPHGAADRSSPHRILTLDSASTRASPSRTRPVNAGAGGRAHGGRKGAPSRVVAPGERVVLADLRGPGTLRHVWCTVPPGRPEVMRALVARSVLRRRATSRASSVPLLDFFALPHGRPVAYASVLTSAQEGRGFNAYFPMPFRDAHAGRVHERVVAPDRCSITNSTTRSGRCPTTPGSCTSRSGARTRPRCGATSRSSTGFRGPGRFLGCAIGVRPIDAGSWYGEGEVKVYRDGDDDWPTICGTGLEDYVGSAWGMGAHHAPYAGAPLDVRRARRVVLLDPRLRRVLPLARRRPDRLHRRVARHDPADRHARLPRRARKTTMDAYLASNPPAGAGWAQRPAPGRDRHGHLRASRRLQRRRVRLLPRRAGGTARRRRRAPSPTSNGATTSRRR